MTWGIPTDTFLQIHVIISLIAIVAGCLVLYGLFVGRASSAWTVLFLATTTLTSVTGFPLPPFGFDPPRALGIILLVLVALAVAALYAYHLAGAWRWIYVGSTVAAFYLNVFVAVIQAFQKLAFLQPLLLNLEAVRMAAKFALAIGATVASRSVFARKNYFYPDLPNGYKISQYELPIVSKGTLEIVLDDGSRKTIGVTRAHLEEDAGKSLHEGLPGVSGIDLNRAGTPLLEIV